jgi:hypothetical protein
MSDSIAFQLRKVATHGPRGLWINMVDALMIGEKADETIQELRQGPHLDPSPWKIPVFVRLDFEVITEGRLRIREVDEEFVFRQGHGTKNIYYQIPRDWRDADWWERMTADRPNEEEYNRRFGIACIY